MCAHVTPQMDRLGPARPLTTQQDSKTLVTAINTCSEAWFTPSSWDCLLGLQPNACGYPGLKLTGMCSLPSKVRWLA